MSNLADRFPKLAVALVRAGVHQVLHAELLRAVAQDVDGPAASASAPGYDAPTRAASGADDTGDSPRTDPAIQRGWDIAFAGGETR